MDTLIKGNIKVEWAKLGEGIDGDYNPDDPDDVELLRFDVSRKTKGHWEAIDDASYCTQIPVSATPEQRQSGLEWIMAEVYEPASQGASIKKICELLSWLSLESLASGQLERRWVLN